MYVKCGFDNDVYGVIIMDEQGNFQLKGRTDVLNNLLRTVASMSRVTDSKEILDAMAETFSGRLWVNKYEGKFNENHDERGLFASGDGGGGSSGSTGGSASSSSGVSSSSTTHNASLLKAIADTGGFTYSPLSGMPTEGLALSIYPEHSAVVDATNIQGSDLQSYMDSKASILKDPSNFVGAWHDTESGKVYLDISKVLPPTAHDQAVALSTQYGQRAYWDIGNSKEIRVVDEAHAHQAASDDTPHETKATKKKIVLVGMLGGQESADELEKVAKQIRDAQAAHNAAKKK